ncbi:MAG: recombinase family protein [Candidatus Paracaedibacter sp.]
MSKIIGYVRVSSFEQNTDRQLEGIKADRIFIEKVSGKDANRPQLKELLNYIRDGDTLIVHSLDRLARNLDDLRRLVQTLTAKDVKVQFLKENLTFTGEDSPMSNLLLSVMGAFAEFERALIRERQLEGIALAKKRGAYKGRKRCLTSEQVEGMKQRVSNGEKKTQIAQDLGVSRETLYQYLRGREGANSLHHLTSEKQNEQ